MLEIEREFLVKEMPDLKNCSYCVIVQGIMPTENADAYVRIRKSLFSESPFTPLYDLTMKQGKGKIREEKSADIQENVFHLLWKSVVRDMIFKIRFYIPLENAIAELDIYLGALRGLVNVEVEFENKKKAHEFAAPEWFGPEVTKDDSFRDNNLLNFGMPKKARRYHSIVGRQMPVFQIDQGVETARNVLRAMSFLDKSLVYIVGGGSSTGKSEFVAEKVKEGFESILISTDDYNKGRVWKVEQEQAGNTLTWDDPEIYDLELIKSDLRLLMDDAPITNRKFDFLVCEAVCDGAIRPAKVIGLEGIYALDKKLAEAGDLNIYVETSLHGRMMRRLMRDIQRTGWTSDKILRYFLEVVEDRHKNFVAPTADNADFIIINEYDPLVEAKNSKTIKNQVKVIANRLTQKEIFETGAVLRDGRSSQMDFYYSPYGRNLHEFECVRIRRVGGKLFWKSQGPINKDLVNIISRPVLEFQISSETSKIFDAVYGSKVIIIAKIRSGYDFEGMIFHFDETVYKSEVNGSFRIMGNFLEFTSEIEKLPQLKNLLAKLLLQDNFIKRAYCDM